MDVWIVKEYTHWLDEWPIVVAVASTPERGRDILEEYRRQDCERFKTVSPPYKPLVFSESADEWRAKSDDGPETYAIYRVTLDEEIKEGVMDHQGY